MREKIMKGKYIMQIRPGAGKAFLSYSVNNTTSVKEDIALSYKKHNNVLWLGLYSLFLSPVLFINPRDNQSGGKHTPRFSNPESTTAILLQDCSCVYARTRHLHIATRTRELSRRV